jgi:hypothetical protein
VGRDLRALFSSNSRELVANDAFTNRTAQWRAVLAALTEHVQRVTAHGFAVDDVESPRRNMIVFHGVGGIGKTTLSRKIEASLTDTDGTHRPAHWRQPLTGGVRLLPVRVDLARSSGTDFERVILSLRLAAAELGRPLPAFDLALRRYWEHAHPGEALEDYLRRAGSGFARFSAAVSLPEQVQAALGDVAQALLLPGSVATAASQLTKTLVRALREHRTAVRALAGCTRLADLLEVEPDIDMLSYTPHLLAWDLAQLPHDKQTVMVVLFDTFEDIGDRTHRDFERLLQRVVWLMPNAFFVVTGRNRLQWASPQLEGQLDWTGPTAWPGLADHADGRCPAQQILVGDFSPEDREDYLAHRLTRDGHPLIPEPVRRTIAERSHGLPLHLDLAVMRYLEIQRTGRTPEPADIDHDFPALITRTLADLTPEERHVARAASLLNAFSIPLVTRAAGLAQEAAATRLVERPFVREDPAAPLGPYHLHQAVRSAIRTADDGTDDRWSPTDWQEATHRALDALGDHLAQHPGDRTTLIACLGQGLTLARAAGAHDLGWLADAAITYVSDLIWEPLTSAAPDADHPDGLRTAADALMETLSALARRQHEHRSRTADRLEAVLASQLLPATLSDLARYYLAKAQRDLGRSSASRHGMQQVVDGQGHFAPAAQRGLAHLARIAGDFPTAWEMAQTLGWDGRQHRVLGDIWWAQGRMSDAADAFLAARTDAEQHGSTGETAIAQAMRAYTLAWTDPASADDELDLAERLLQHADLRATRINTQLAALIRDAGTTTDLEERARAVHTEISVAGLTPTHATLQFILAFHHAVQDDHDAVRADITELRRLTRTGDYVWYVDLVHFMADLPVPAQPASPACWIDGEGSTRARWRSLVTTRRELQDRNR